MVFFLCYALYARFRAVRRIRKLASKLQCQPPHAQQQWRFLFGVDILMRSLTAVNKHTVLDYLGPLHTENSYNFSSHMFGDPAFQTTQSDPENVKALLSTQWGEFDLGWKHRRALRPLIGDGILTADGRAWRHAREVLRPKFSRAQLHENLDMLEKHFQRLRSRITSGTVVDLQQLYHKLTLDVSTEFLFGIGTDSLLGRSDVRVDEFDTNLEKAQHGASLRLRLGKLNAVYTSRTFSDACRKVRRFGREALDDTLSPEKLRSAADGEEAGYSFIRELAKDVNDREVLLDHALNMLAAGRDTTAGLVSISTMVLARDSRVCQKLRNAISHLEGRPPTFEELKNVTYLQHFLKEVLRLYPINPLIGRQANIDTTLPRGGGVDGTSKVLILKDTFVLVAIFAMHRRTDLYGDDALEFRPERWAALRPGHAYVPFGAGPRKCLGQQLALTEASYIIVRLLQQFPVLQSEDPLPFQVHLGSTLASKNGCLVSLR